MDKNKQKAEKFVRPNLEPILSLFLKSWRLFCSRFLDFIEMYLWGLLGSLPLLGIILLVILGSLFFGMEAIKLTAVLIPVTIILALASLWAIYYGIRAHIGLWILINEPQKKVRTAFLDSRGFFERYLLVSIFSGLLLMLLFLAFIIPGLIFYCYWSFATMLVVVEGTKNTKESLKRSKYLVKGYWWPVALRFIFIASLYTIFVGIISIPIYYMNDVDSERYGFLVNLFSTLITPLLLVYTYFLYKNLASKK